MNDTNALQNLNLLLNDIEETCDPEIGSEASRNFSLDCLSLIAARSPSICEEALRLLKSESEIQTTALDELYVRCWNFIESHLPNKPITTPEVSAVRATICTLYAATHRHERNIVDHLSFFLELVNNVLPISERHEELLRQHFAGCFE
jgi:hypothetical protein